MTMAMNNARKAYDLLPEGLVDEDLQTVLDWAKKTLADQEGTGHIFHLMATRDGLMYCSFCKPEWSGDHCGGPMEGAGEAIAMAVCEYLNGV